mmetsp:Transcript_43114/g.93691  ORF Transcript_43114/g.93691 Transcript_43114/m.93691 type:complete len:313 (+) Transcript_43114:16-954(+)
MACPLALGTSPPPPTAPGAASVFHTWCRHRWISTVWISRRWVAIGSIVVRWWRWIVPSISRIATVTRWRISRIACRASSIGPRRRIVAWWWWSSWRWVVHGPIATIIIRPIILSATFPVAHDFLWHTPFHLHPLVVDLVQLVIGQGSLDPFGLFESHKSKATVPLRLSIHHHHSILNRAKLSKVLLELLQIAGGWQAANKNLDDVVHATPAIISASMLPTMPRLPHGPFAIHGSTINLMGSTNSRIHRGARGERHKAKATRAAAVLLGHHHAFSNLAVVRKVILEAFFGGTVRQISDIYLRLRPHGCRTDCS